MSFILRRFTLCFQIHWQNIYRNCWRISFIHGAEFHNICVCVSNILCFCFICFWVFRTLYVFVCFKHYMFLYVSNIICFRVFLSFYVFVLDVFVCFEYNMFLFYIVLCVSNNVCFCVFPNFNSLCFCFIYFRTFQTLNVSVCLKSRWQAVTHVSVCLKSRWQAVTHNLSHLFHYI